MKSLTHPTCLAVSRAPYTGVADGRFEGNARSYVSAAVRILIGSWAAPPSFSVGLEKVKRFFRVAAHLWPSVLSASGGRRPTSDGRPSEMPARKRTFNHLRGPFHSAVRFGSTVVYLIVFLLSGSRSLAQQCSIPGDGHKQLTPIRQYL